MKNPFDPSDFSDFFAEAFNAASAESPGATALPAPAVLGAPIDIPEEEREAEAAVAASGTGAPGSMVAVGSSAGLAINLMFDNAAMSAPQSFRDGITQAMQMICAVVTDKITINLQIDWSGTGGSAAAGPSGGNYVSYSTVRADLVNNASPGDTTFNFLPGGSTIAGQNQVAVWLSQEKLWGLINPTGTEVDGSATFSTDINPNLLVGVALHELTHAMGRVPYGPSTSQPTVTQPDIFDFYRFTSSGNILIDGNDTAPAAYFSLNGGATKLADYGRTSDPSDFLNSGVQGSTDPFNEFYSNSTQQQLTAMDLMQLDALGFHLVSNQQTQTVIESFGSTRLVQVGSNFYLNPVSGGTGPELKLSGAAFTAGSTWGAWAPIGAEATAGGYEVAFKVGADTYTVWNTDTSGNITTNALATSSGSSAGLESLETSFQQDLNGDGIIGLPAATTSIIEAFGATALAQSGSNYFLNPVAGGTGPELTYGGSPWAAGQAWAPIGAERTSTGYEVALFNVSSHLYAVWNTDSSGNVLSSPISGVTGTNTALESIETSFQQDLNGDGVIGLSNATVIEAFGTTKLVLAGNDYFLNPVAGGAGPELMYSGTPWAGGQAWAPIGAEQTSTGYEVALYNASSHLYAVWNTDSSGSVSSAPIAGVSGTNAALESIEVSFQQDLNGDGVIGLSNATVVEAFGATKLVEASNDYFFNPVAGGSGPELMYGGTPWAAGQAWAPIGGEKTSSGYEVALFNASSQLYAVWNTDSSGNVLSSPISGVTGASTALETYETSFQQDLNGDGTIGVPSHSLSAQVAAAAPAAPAPSSWGDGFIFRSDVASINAPTVLQSAASPPAGEVTTPATPSAAVSHIDVADAHDPAGSHDAAVHNVVFDPLHGFIIH